MCSLFLYLQSRPKKKRKKVVREIDKFMEEMKQYVVVVEVFAAFRVFCSPCHAIRVYHSVDALGEFVEYKLYCCKQVENPSRELIVPTPMAVVM